VLIPFPKVMPVVCDKKTARLMIQQAVARFEGDYRPKRFRQILRSVQRLQVPNAKDQRYLRKVRRHALVVKTTLDLFGEEKSCPKKFRLFVRTLGQINDAVSANQMQRAAHHAETIKEWLPRPTTICKIGSTRPGATEKVRRNFDHIVTKIETRLTSRLLPAQDFHDLRKDIRKIFHAIRIYDVIVPSRRYQQGRRYLHALNDQLGELHDKLVLGELAGALRYQKQRVGVSPHFRSAMLRVTKSLEII
jgi:CHAD domain-containing protein